MLGVQLASGKPAVLNSIVRRLVEKVASKALNTLGSIRPVAGNPCASWNARIARVPSGPITPVNRAIVVAPLGKRPLYLHRQIFPILVTVSRCGIVIRILVGISVVGISAVDVSVARVPPIRKTERNQTKSLKKWR
jgi:hypothetical protein